MEVLYWSLFWYALLCVLSSFAIMLTRRAGCFAFIVLRMLCYCKNSVAFPCGAWVGLQCVSGIS